MPFGSRANSNFLLGDHGNQINDPEDTEEITKLKRGLQTNGGLYEINEKCRDVTLKIHPYFLEPDSTDIKKKKVPFIYNE